MKNKIKSLIARIRAIFTPKPPPASYQHRPAPVKLGRLKMFTVSAILAGVIYAAFRMSFDNQVILAEGVGFTPVIALHYPLIVDAALLVAVLIRMWMPDLNTRHRTLVDFTIALWTTISILGNSWSVATVPPDSLTLPVQVAVIVHSIPSITLFLGIHVAANTIYNPRASSHAAAAAAASAQTVTRRQPRSPEAAGAPPRVQRASDIPEVSDAELLAMADGEGLSMQAIADRIQRSKSYVGERVKRLRDARDAADLVRVAQ